MSWYLKFHYCQIDFKWLDADSIMSKKTMKYDLIKMIYSLDP